MVTKVGNYTGKTIGLAICAAIQQGNVEVVRLLVNDRMINKNGGNPLLIAIEMGRLEIVQILLKHPTISVNQVNESGHSPLQVAIEMAKSQGEARQDAIVEELLNHKQINLELLDEKEENNTIKKSCTYQPVINFIDNILKILNDKKTDNNVAEMIENWEWILSGLKDDIDYAPITDIEEKRVDLFNGISANLDACKDYLPPNNSNDIFFNSNPNSFIQLKKDLSNIEKKVIERGSRLSPAESLKPS